MSEILYEGVVGMPLSQMPFLPREHFASDRDRSIEAGRRAIALILDGTIYFSTLYEVLERDIFNIYIATLIATTLEMTSDEVVKLASWITNSAGPYT